MDGFHLRCLLALAGAIAIPGALSGNDRFTVFISDTHFGVGRDPDGKWNNYEDARWPTEFALFLDYLDAQGKGKTDLIINGDMFELWQSLEQDCIDPSDKNLGCSARDRIRRILRSSEPGSAAE